MPCTRSSLTSDLRALGLKPGDTVMVHASVRSVGPVFGGPDEIHQAVVDAVSPDGTMMMLLGCPDGYDEIGRPRISAEVAAALRAHLPVFDKHATRADRSNGTLCEFFRTWPGTMVSDSVSVRIGARGAHSDWLVSEHPQIYPFGRGTPFEKLLQAKGKLLLLGSDHDQVTLMHYAETIGDFPDKIIVTYEVPMMVEGRRTMVRCEEFDSSSSGAHANWPDRFFALIVDDFIARHEGTALCAHGKVGESDSYLLDAAALVAHAVPIMEQTAKGDPYFKDHSPAGTAS